MSNPHRVLLVENDPHIGGSGRSLQVLIAGLDRRRFEVMTVCKPDGSIGRCVRDLGVACHWPSGASTGGRWLGSRIAWVWWLRRLIRRQRVDLVHVNDIAGFRLAGLAACLAGVPAVCHFRMAREPEGVAWAFGLARPAAMIFNSRAMAEHHRPILPPSFEGIPAIIAPNAVDTNRFRPAIDMTAAKERLGWLPEVASVTVVGNLSPLKGQDVFVDAATRIAEAVTGPVRFHIIGRDLSSDGWFAQSLLEQIDRLGMADRIRFHGSTDDVVPVYQASDVVVWSGRAVSVCPSGDGTQVRQVGFPRCVIEAAGCGRPQVLTDTPGVSEAAIDGETAVFVPTEDSSAMADAVSSLLRDHSRREAMGKAGRNLIESDFGLTSHGRQIAKVYDSVLNTSLGNKQELLSLPRALMTEAKG